jgi:galactokinase
MQVVTAFAPGRVELLGNHTDYNEGVVLSAAIHLGITAKGWRSDDGRIRLTSEGFEEGVDVAADAPFERTEEWSDYPLGVAHVLRSAGCAVGGFEAEFSSTLPEGAGLSSSAALEVATGVLATRLFGCSIKPLALAKLCRRAENECVGVNCGLLDQVSSIFGKRQHAIHLDCRSDAVETIPMPAGVELLIIHSGVRHALTGGEYNERRGQCYEAARLMGVPALRDVTSEQLEKVEMPAVVKRRARHIVGENERVEKAVELLRKGDVASFGILMTESHRSSIKNFENSTSELDVLVEIATSMSGVYGSRLTGGGFGGATVSLVQSASAELIGEAIVNEYQERTGRKTSAYRCHIGDGATAWKEG